jgi:hypothetical protein
MTLLTSEKSWDKKQLLEALDHITIDELQSFFPQIFIKGIILRLQKSHSNSHRKNNFIFIFKGLFIEGIAFGNISPKV